VWRTERQAGSADYPDVPGFGPPYGFAPIARSVTIGWCLACGVFFVYAAADTDGFLFLDNANLMIHEAGHALFAWAGDTTQILGGTIAQLLVPLGCVLLFVRRGDTAAVAATACWGFENLLYVATYMADARRSALPLVGSDESDWTILFTQWGVLHQDTAIAAWTRSLGWIGMLASVAWLVWMHVRLEAAAYATPSTTR